MRRPRPLKTLTRAQLEPLWMRKDISTEKIAQALGVSRQSISWKAKALGLPSRQGNMAPIKRVSDELFARMWMAGVSMKDLAEQCGYSQANTAIQRRIRLGLPGRTRGKCPAGIPRG